MIHDNAYVEEEFPMQIIKLASVVGAISGLRHTGLRSGISPAKITGPIPVTAQSRRALPRVERTACCRPGIAAAGASARMATLRRSISFPARWREALTRPRCWCASRRILPSFPALSPSRRYMRRVRSLFGACAMC